MIRTERELLIDSSAIMTVLNNEPRRDAVIRATAGRALVGADSLPFEVANAITAGFKQGKLDLAQGLAAWKLFESMSIRLLPVPIADALRLAAKHQAYAYDAGVVALASASGVPLLSFDRGMRHIARAERLELFEGNP